jgi:hypothetical protein
VNVEPARVTVVVPEPVYTIASVLAGFEATKFNVAVPLPDPVAVKS